MKLTGKKILLRQFVSKKTTSGGIALPDSSQERVPIGRVLDIGPNVLVDLHDRDVVLFNDLASAVVNVGGQHYVLIEPDDILLILEEGDYDGIEKPA